MADDESLRPPSIGAAERLSRAEYAHMASPGHRFGLPHAMLALLLVGAFFQLRGAPMRAQPSALDRLGGPALKDPEVMSALTSARTYWGGLEPTYADGERCHEGVVVGIAPDTSSDGRIAEAEVRGCVIRLDPTFYPMPSEEAASPTGRMTWRTTLCTAMIHEYGHLLGKGHSTNPSDIMYYAVNFHPRECIKAAARLEAELAATARTRAGG